MNMRATNWAEWTDDGTAARRAGGRRAYNRWRGVLASMRFNLVLAEWVKLIKERGRLGFHRGHQSEIARRLGVHRSTVSRDFKKLRLLDQGCSWAEVELAAKLWHRSAFEAEFYFCKRLTIAEWLAQQEPHAAESVEHEFPFGTSAICS